MSLWWPGNFLPEDPLTDEESIGDFYDKHQIVGHRAGYAAKVPQELKHLKGPHLHLLFFIDVNKVHTSKFGCLLVMQH